MADEDDDPAPSSPPTASASGASTCSSTTPASGVGAAVGEMQTKRVDLQLDVNLRAMILFYRECAGLLRAAGAEHRNALVVNMASISGKAGQAWLSVYSATKAGVIGWTQAMNKELNGEGIKSRRAVPRLRRHADDRVRARARAARRQMIQHGGRRGGGPLPAAHLAELRRARDRLPARR